VHEKHAFCLLFVVFIVYSHKVCAHVCVSHAFVTMKECHGMTSCPPPTPSPLCICPSLQESHALFDYLDRDKDGWLDYNDLVASLGINTQDMQECMSLSRLLTHSNTCMRFGSRLHPDSASSEV
jgi:hypothetical protein